MGPSAHSNSTAFIKSHFFTKMRQAPSNTNLTGQVAIITGASSGLGLHAAQHFLSLKLSHLILAVRSLEKGEAFAEKLRIDYPAATIDVFYLEMSSYESIQAFCRRIDSDLPRLDFTILNAAISTLEFAKCETTGHERTIQVNYLSTFLLAILMLPISKKLAPRDKPGRLTIVSSGTTGWVQVPSRDKRPFLESLDDIDAWDAGDRYSVSKALGHLFFTRMINYLNADDVVVNMVEPGFTKGTELFRNLSRIQAVFFGMIQALTARKVVDAAWTYVDAAVVQGKESHGCFCEDWEIHPFTKLVYLPEGQPLMDTLWEETLTEFDFAGARGILNAL
ncbi:hypothetical protein BX600DRAFT_480579 [Xylariales sp. PMI_506]|nr:hypothetical protein BX600DRAFT_480579 [Xylariales sp. PMI_506]